MNQYGPRQPNGPAQDPRNGSFGARVNGRPNEEVESNQARAARFEDEKKRIIESCFAKRDPDGTQLESYITHVKVIEDAIYPSSPPPPDAPPSNKKSRVILVAVRRSGKVRVHKARENPSGTFSIGKTWNLDELTAIQSYTAFMPGNQQEAYEKNWAGNTGFIVSLGKPYYWQAATGKEKDFYIASLIKIFRKYTGGKLPQLIGFPAQDLEMLGSASPNPQTPTMKNQTPPISQTAVPSPPQIPAATAPRPQSPYSARAPSRGTNRSESQDHGAYGQNEYRPVTREKQRLPSEDAARSPQRLPDQPAPSDTSSQSFRDRQPSQDSYGSRGPPKQDLLQAQPPRPSISPKSSQSSLPQMERRAELPVSTQNGTQNPGLSAFEAARRNLALAAKSQESVGAKSDYSAPSRPITSSGGRKTPEPVPPMPQKEYEALPERRRPPIALDQSSFEELSVQETSNTAFFTPSETPKNASGASTPKDAPTTASTKPQQAEYFNAKPPTIAQDVAATPSIPGAFTEPKATTPGDTKEAVQTPPPTEKHDERGADQQKKDEEEYRPGLGPMLKKKSGKDIANQFRKAALAASAFQPRSGGAGARLKAMQEKTSNEPDGITGVVPAPLLRGMSSDSAVSTPSVVSPGLEKERPHTPLSNSILPKVQIQRTATDDSAASVKSAAPPKQPVEQPKVEPRPSSPEKARSRSPQRKRRQRQEAEIEKYCSILSLDPRIMEGRGADFNEILTEFGWEGKLPEKQKNRGLRS